MIEGRITELLEQKLNEEEWRDCFIVEVKHHAVSGKLDVFIDSDTGITFDKCRQISRYLEEYLDTHLWLGEKYTLEVSSPGLSRPLMLLRQYKKNIGRKLEVKLKEGSKQEGVLTEVNDNSITLEEKVRIKEGKKKKTVLQSNQIPFEDIAKAKVKISFN